MKNSAIKYLFIIFSINIFLFINNKIYAGNEKMKIKEEVFGKLKTGEKVKLFTLTNKNGIIVKIINYGGIIISIKTPDESGKLAEIVLGYDNLEGYLENSPYFGAIVGRYANRIANGEFKSDGKTYKLAKNNGNNSLHGGLKGFDKVLWNALPIRNKDSIGVRMYYLSKSGEEGYPGNLEVGVDYLLNNQNELKIYYTAKTDKPTPVNLTNHTYFNLKCGGCSDILNHILYINSDKFTEISDELIPTGKILSVKDTPLDFTKPHKIGERIDKLDTGYDHNFVLNRQGKKLSIAARVIEPETGRVLEVQTTQPGLQFYSGNFLDGSIKGHNNIVYKKHSGFCLETQRFPDSPNHKSFPNTILKSNQIYRETTIYKFTIK
jgi:aldose 1-epimerase